MKKVTSVFLLALLFLYPLYFGFGGYTSIEEEKYIMFLILCGGFVLFSAVFPLQKRLVQTGKDLRRKKSRFLLPLCYAFAAALLLSMIVSAVASPFGAGTWLGFSRKDGVLTWALYLLCFALLAAFGELKPVHFFTVTAVAVITGVIVTLQFWGLNPFELYPPGYTFHDRYLKYGSEFLGTIGNSDLLSAFLCLIVPLLIGRFIISTKKSDGIFLAGAAFGWWALLLSEVKGGLLGILAACLIGCFLVLKKRAWIRRFLLVLVMLAAVGAVYGTLVYQYQDGIVAIWLHWSTLTGCLLAASAVFLLLYFLLRRTNRFQMFLAKNRYRYAFLGFGVAAIGAFLTVYYFGKQLSTTSAELSALLHGQVSDSFGSSRILIWREMLKLIRERPLLGGGPDTLSLRYSEEFSKVLPDGSFVTVVDVAHSGYLNLWVNTGIFSLVSYLALLVSILLPAIRRRGSDTVCLLFPILAFCVQDAVGIHEFIVAPLFWVLLGLLWRSIKKEEIL